MGLDKEEISQKKILIRCITGKSSRRGAQTNSGSARAFCLRSLRPSSHGAALISPGLATCSAPVLQHVAARYRVLQWVVGCCTILCTFVLYKVRYDLLSSCVHA